MGFSRFISDNEEDEYRRGLGEEDPNKDWAWLVSAMRKPEEAIAPASTDPRQPRSGGGGIDAFTSARDAAGGDAPKGEGDTGTVSPTAKRIQIAQWGTEDPDEDRVTPESIGQNTKMLSSTDNTAPTKPPGPDSPAPNYKDPASSFLEASGYAARKKAYDQDWDPSGKWKGGFKIETTQQRMARREMQQRDVMEAEEQGLRMFDRSREDAWRTRVRPSGQAMRMTGDQGDGIYQGYSDGTFKKVGGVLDKDANEKYEPGVVTTGDRWLGRVRNDSNVVDPLMGKFFSSDADPFAGGAGPLSPDAEVPQRKWIAEKNDPDEFVNLPEGTARYRLKKGGGYEEVIPARPKTSAPKSGEGGIPKDPSAQAKKEAEKEADELLKGNKEYERASPEARKATRDMWIRKILDGNKSGGAAPAKPKRTVVVG